MLLAISSPADNERGAIYAEQVLAALHQANRNRLPVTLLFGRHDQTVGLYCRVPEQLESTLRHPQFEDAIERTAADPLSGLLGAVAPQGRGDVDASIEITVSPARRRRHRQARRVVELLNKPFLRSHRRIAYAFAVTASRSRTLCMLAWLAGLLTNNRFQQRDPLATSASRLHDREDDLQAAYAKVGRGRHLFETHIRITAAAAPHDRAGAKAMLRNTAAAFAQFNGLATFHAARFRSRCGFLLSDEELATIWHPPIATVQTPPYDPQCIPAAGTACEDSPQRKGAGRCDRTRPPDLPGSGRRVRHPPRRSTPAPGHHRENRHGKSAECSIAASTNGVSLDRVRSLDVPVYK